MYIFLQEEVTAVLNVNPLDLPYHVIGDGNFAAGLIFARTAV